MSFRSYLCPSGGVLAVVLGFFAANNAVLAQKAEDAADKGEKKAPAVTFNPAQQVGLWRLNLQRVQDQQLAPWVRVASLEVLAQVFQESKRGFGGDAVAAAIALGQEILQFPPANEPAAGLLARVALALGVLGELDRGPATAFLISLLENHIAFPHPCPHNGCRTPYARPGTWFAVYVFGKDFRSAAALALGRLGTPEAINALVDTLLKDLYPRANKPEEVFLQAINADLRLAILKALRDRGSDPVLIAVRTAKLTDPDEKVRHEADETEKAIAGKSGQLKMPKKEIEK